MSPSSKAIPSFFEPVMNLPWHVTLLLGEAVFALFKWVLPVLCSSDNCPQPIGVPWSDMAWLFAGMFLLRGLVVYAAQKKLAWLPFRAGELG